MSCLIAHAEWLCASLATDVSDYVNALDQIFLVGQLAINIMFWLRLVNNILALVNPLHFNAHVLLRMLTLTGEGDATPTVMGKIL